MGSGRRSLLTALLLLLLLLPPAAWGDCGPLPTISHAEPYPGTDHLESFTMGSKVTYRCAAGYTKRPSLSDTIQCLSNSQWSHLPEFCGRSCPALPRVRFAKVSPEYETQNFFPVGITVKYVCRPGYENTTEQLPTSTCLDNLTWSEVPELCQRQSCGIPTNPEHGEILANNHLFGTRANVVCDRGYTLRGESPIIFCSLRGRGVAWSSVPACQAIFCAPPPATPNGQHNGSDVEEFTYSLVVMYVCNPGLQLVGNETLHCTTEDGINGVWSGSPPVCTLLVSTTGEINETEPLEENTEENPHSLRNTFIISGVGAAIILICLIAYIIVKHKGKKTHSYNMPLEKQRRDPAVHPQITGDEKQPLPWRSYFCHTTSCHVCPTCEERLHAALDPRTKPTCGDCATCKDWLRGQLGMPRTYSVPSIGSEEIQSLAVTSSLAKAADVLRGDGEAVLEQSKAEWPTAHLSTQHICPVCESWLRTHLGQQESHPTAPWEQLGDARRWDEGPQRPICAPCADRLHLSLVHGDTAGRPVCPLPGEGTLAHLVPQRIPGCHVCPICAVPTHTHLCQPNGDTLMAAAS